MTSHVVELHRRVWNPRGAHRALLLHGLGSDGATMWRLADHLAGRGFAVTAPDLRGQGLSPPSGSYRLGEMADDVRALATGWDLVVGHSMGGAVAAHLLGDADFAAGGLLLDPVLRVAQEDLPDIEAGLVMEAGGNLTEERIRARAPLWDDEDVFRLVRAGALLSPSVVRQILHATQPWDLMESVQRWAVPVTILAADPAVETLFTPDHAAAVTAACATARVVTVPQAGHNLHRDAPDTVLAALDHAIGGLRTT